MEEMSNACDVLKAISISPASFLMRLDSLSLGTFLNGCSLAEASIGRVLDTWLDRRPALTTFGMAVRVYLSNENAEEALRSLLCELLAIADGLDDLRVTRGEYARCDIMSLIVGEVRAGTVVRLLLDCTAEGVVDFVNGFLCGLAVLDPAAATAQRRQLRDFEHDLQQGYGTKLPWSAILRAVCYAGGGLTVLDGLWDDRGELHRSSV